MLFGLSPFLRIGCPFVTDGGAKEQITTLGIEIQYSETLHVWETASWEKLVQIPNFNTQINSLTWSIYILYFSPHLHVGHTPPPFQLCALTWRKHNFETGTHTVRGCRCEADIQRKAARWWSDVIVLHMKFNFSYLSEGICDIMKLLQSLYQTRYLTTAHEVMGCTFQHAATMLHTHTQYRGWRDNKLRCHSKTCISIQYDRINCTRAGDCAQRNMNACEPKVERKSKLTN